MSNIIKIILQDLRITAIYLTRKQFKLKDINI